MPFIPFADLDEEEPQPPRMDPNVAAFIARVARIRRERKAAGMRPSGTVKKPELSEKEMRENPIWMQ